LRREEGRCVITYIHTHTHTHTHPCVETIYTKTGKQEEEKKRKEKKGKERKGKEEHTRIAMV